MPPLVTVIMPVRNEADHIEACLRSVLSQEEPEGGFEIIVADGKSTDGTREILGRIGSWEMGDGRWELGVGGEMQRIEAAKGRSEIRNQKSEIIPQPSEERPDSTIQPLNDSTNTDSGPSPAPLQPSAFSPPNAELRTPNSELQSSISDLPSSQLRVIDNPQGIVATGLNRAIRAARGEIIIRMDAHTEYAPDYLKRCVETLAKTGADNVGGPARTVPKTYFESAIAAAYHSPFSVGGARFHDPKYDGNVDTVTYGCWRRELFERVGYFDEELVRNQDDEHNLRIVRAGGKVWQSPRIKSWYRPRGSLGALFRQYMQYGYWKVRVIQKHRLPASWRHLVPGAFLLTLVLLAMALLLCLVAPYVGLQTLDFGLWTSDFGLRLSHLRSPISYLLTGLLTVYCLTVALASLHTASRTQWSLLPVLPLVFPCYHLGYGFGFLRGVLDFVLLRRRPGQQFVQLTRPSAAEAPHP